MEQHAGLLRTELTEDERKALRAEARRRGMTIRGYVDQILRAEIERCYDPRREDGKAAVKTVI